MPSVADLEAHLGRTLAREDIVAPGPARAALAMLGRNDWAPAAGDALPPATVTRALRPGLPYGNIRVT